jgi:putative peptidoglycan lipid II flippase
MRSPVRVAILALIANILLSLALMGPLKHSGLALANSISAILNFLLLMVWITKRIGTIDWRRISTSLGKVFLACLPMGVIVHRLSLLGQWGDSRFILSNGLILGVSVMAGVCVFLFASLLLRTEEALFLFSLIKRRLKG